MKPFRTMPDSFMRSFAGLLALLLTACASTPPPVAAAEPDHREPAPKLEAPLVGWVERYVAAIGAEDEAQRFHGTILVAKGDEVLLERDFGPKTGRRYRIGSVTKPFTAVALLQLASEGKLALDDSIRKHLPELPEAMQPITLAQLLSHRGGTANYTEDESLMAARDQPKSQAEMIALIAAEPLRFETGTKWRYSNSGYFLLGVTIERVAQKPWFEVVKERVLGPAGMTETDRDDAGLATPLAVKEGKLVPAHGVDTSIPFSAGSLVSTARDLHRFALALWDDRLLPSAWRERMWQDRGGPTPELGWSYGFMLRTREGHATVGHNGGIDGFTSHWEFEKQPATAQKGFVVVSLSHVEDFDAGSVGTPALTMALTDRAIEPPQPTVMRPFDAALCESLAGTYALPEATEQALAEKIGDKVVATIRRATVRCEGGYRFKPVGQGEITLEEREDGALVSEPHSIEVRAEPAVEGTVSKLILKQGGLVVDYQR